MFTQEVQVAAEREAIPVFRLNSRHLAAISLISVIYFTDTLLKASHKCYWFDELFTVYLCRLPRFSSIWAATLHGADFNPPLFYLLTRFTQRLFGDGYIGTRMPATAGVWIFGLCLFLFVARRAGVIAGFIAGTFPFFTLAQYYTYEARPHGLVLGWCGLSLLCWQRQADQGRTKHLWLAGFALSLLGALLTHVYAVYLFVPFAVVELYNLLKRQRINWSVLVAMPLVMVPVVALVYLPLFRMYRSTVRSGFFVPSHELFQSFLVSVFGPALCVLLLMLILFGLEEGWRARLATARALLPEREMILAIGFVCIPALGFVGSRISHGPFIDRYFLSSIAGFAMFLGYAHAQRAGGRWCARTLAGGMMLLMIADLGLTIYLVSGAHRIVLYEPSSRSVVSTTPGDPMRMFQTVSEDHDGLDVLVLPSLDYFYFFEYAPRTVVPHLYFAAPAADVGLGLYQKLERWLPVDFKTTTFSSFLGDRTRFLLYENSPADDVEALQAISGKGYKLVSAKGDASGVMYEYAK